MPRPSRPRRIVAVRWYDAAGKRVPPHTRGASKRRETSATWYATLDGKTVSLGTTDEGLAWVELRRLLRERQERAAGIRTPATDAARRPLAEHIEEWLCELTAKGTSPDRIATLRTRLTRLAAEAGWTH